MKKTIRTIISILAVGAMLLSFAACESKKEDTVKDDTVKEDTVMKAVFEDITSDAAYLSWKEMYPAATIEEKLDGSKLTFTVTYKDGAPADQEEDDITNDAEIAAGEFVFTHDGDYIVGASGSTEKYVNPFAIQVRNAVCHYFNMSIGDVNDYLMANADNTYFIEDLENKTTKIYVAEKWNIS